MPRAEDGRVLRVSRREVWVEVEGERVVCRLRGRLRQQGRSFQVAAGDVVRVVRGLEGSDAAIEGVAPRSSWLSRYLERGGQERVIVANVDRVFAVTAIRDPVARFDFIDRVLVSAEWGRANACVVINKIDLAMPDEVAEVRGTYTASGYPVVEVSARTGEGLEGLAEAISGGIYAFVGESGVGKTSLLMRLDPALDLAVREIGDNTRRGRHTTTYSQLFSFSGGYLADTPGVQIFGFPGNEAVALAACFPEFGSHEQTCRFSPCTHSHEPDCGVKRALESGTLQRTRYNSYLNILKEVEARVGRRGR